MKIYKKLCVGVVLMSLLAVVITSCREDEFTETIFDNTWTDPYFTQPGENRIKVGTDHTGKIDIYMDTTEYTYEFDRWIFDEYIMPYNLDFRYKMQDVGSDQDYNLVPAKLEMSDTLAHLARYLWFDVYGTVVNEDFLKQYGPRMMHLIGSPAINAAQGTIVLGTAEGGIKITLYYVNNLNPRDASQMNEYYFKTMHHEFAHILHQTKTYPKDYATISTGLYDPSGWQLVADSVANQKGFVTSYAMSETREDFVEVIANYIVKTDADWNNILETANRGVIEVVGTGEFDKDKNEIMDTITGRDIIMQKWNMCNDWLAEKWNISLDALRDEVQTRQANLDLEKIMNDDY